MKFVRKGLILSHAAIWLVVILFWFLYYFFNTQKAAPSVASATMDTLCYAVGYYVITLALLPRLLKNRRALPFAIAFVLLVIAVGAMRLQGYRLTRWYFDEPYKITGGSFVYIFVTTLTILAASASIHLVIDWLKSERRLEQIRREHVSTELSFLKNQLNPHFLFNSLNTLYGSIDMQNEEARNILLKLSEILRYQLYECSGDKVDIEKEVTYLRNYVALQSLRANPGLAVDLNIDPSVKGVSLPPLLWLPLVENAFKHVSKFKSKENRISLSWSRREGKMDFAVVNSMEDGNREPEASSGIGIVNVRRRLELLYPGKHQLNISNRGSEFAVHLVLMES